MELANANLRLIEMSAQMTYDLDENGEWRLAASETPVDEQFNIWAAREGMVPIHTPVICPAVSYSPDGQRIIHVLTLSAVVVKAEDYARREESRCQIMAEKLSPLLQQLLAPPPPSLPTEFVPLAAAIPEAPPPEPPASPPAAPPPPNPQPPTAARPPAQPVKFPARPTLPALRRPR